jgi:copper/silver efflux system protein
MMSVMAILVGLLPIMWSQGAGADVIKRIAAPMIGGLISSFLLELLVYPVIYEVWRGWEIRKLFRGKSQSDPIRGLRTLTEPLQLQPEWLGRWQDYRQ